MEERRVVSGKYRALSLSLPPAHWAPHLLSQPIWHNGYDSTCYQIEMNQTFESPGMIVNMTTAKTRTLVTSPVASHHCTAPSRMSLSLDPALGLTGHRASSNHRCCIDGVPYTVYVLKPFRKALGKGFFTNSRKPLWTTGLSAFTFPFLENLFLVQKH